jgi:hypothetical protein
LNIQNKNYQEGKRKNQYISKGESERKDTLEQSKSRKETRKQKPRKTSILAV